MSGKQIKKTKMCLAYKNGEKMTENLRCESSPHMVDFLSFLSHGRFFCHFYHMVVSVGFFFLLSHGRFPVISYHMVDFLSFFLLHARFSVMFSRETSIVTS